MSEIREKTYEVKDMLAYESTRKANKIPGTLVHWRREGKFYHAYEWSAWLAYNYIFKFKAQRTKSKDNDYVYVGFPPDSLEKFTPEGVVVTVSDDGVFVDMLLPPAGNSNGNVGSNGNYWSSTSGNYRLNFNTSNMNVNSNTNSYCVRLAAVVEHFSLFFPTHNQ